MFDRKKLVIINLGEGYIFFMSTSKKISRTLNLRDWIVDLRNKFNFGMFMES